MEACGALAAAPQITRVQLAQRRRVVTPADEYIGNKWEATRGGQQKGWGVLLATL